VWRFAGLPGAYYRDWLRVAAEEAHHYTLLADHLATLGHAYGDFDAHDGLWAMTERTAGDITARMALVPRTLEARGGWMPRRRCRRGWPRPATVVAVEILDVILRDEIGHVAVGNRWYRWLCERDGLDPVRQYAVLAARHGAPRLRPPFNHGARLARRLHRGRSRRPRRRLSVPPAMRQRRGRALHCDDSNPTPAP